MLICTFAERYNDMTIEFCAINKPEDWIEMVAEQFGTSVTNDGFIVPPSVGSGFFKQYYPLSWLTLTYISFRIVRTDDNGASLGGKLEMDSRDVLYQRA